MPLRVVMHGDGSCVAVCDEDPDVRVTVARDELIVYELDARKLRTAAASALEGVTIARTPIGSADRCFRIGYWQPRASVQVPLDLVIVFSAEALLRRVLRSEPGMAFLATPTDRFWQEEVRSAAAARKLQLLALDRLIDLGANGGWSATPAWKEHTEAMIETLASGRRGNARPAVRPARRAPRLTAIEQLERALEEHIRAARDHAYDWERRNLPPRLLPRPEQRQLARQLGLTESQVSRALNDPRATKLKILWDTAESLESVMRFRQ